MARFRTTYAPAVSRRGLLRAHVRGLRRLVQDEPEIFAVMGELALRSARDPGIADLFGATIETWHRTTRGLIEAASKDPSLSGNGDPDAQASLVISAVMGGWMIPLNRPARLAETFRALEGSLGMRER